jgi:hypothetical protein
MKEISPFLCGKKFLRQHLDGEKPWGLRLAWAQTSVVLVLFTHSLEVISCFVRLVGSVSRT